MATPIPNLPFEPESTDSLRSRFVDAIAVPLNPLAGLVNGEIPGTNRKHVFDFQDGWRLQVTLTDFEAANATAQTKFPIRFKKMIHVSGRHWRVEPRTPIAQEKREVLEHFRLLSGILTEPTIDLRTNVSYQFFFKPAENPKDGQRPESEDSQVSQHAD